MVTFTSTDRRSEPAHRYAGDAAYALLVLGIVTLAVAFLVGIVAEPRRERSVRDDRALWIEGRPQLEAKR